MAGAYPTCPGKTESRSFHGGGLVTDNPNSPHLLAPRIKARMYFGIAANDDMRQPEAKDKLYDMADADRAWGKLITLYKAALA
jgi:carboxymethylenebutenolidase